MENKIYKDLVKKITSTCCDLRKMSLAEKHIKLEHIIRTHSPEMKPMIVDGNGIFRSYRQEKGEVVLDRQVQYYLVENFDEQSEDFYNFLYDVYYGL